MTRIAIVDDHEEIRVYLDKVVAASNEILVVGSWGSAEDALRELPSLDVDVVLMDIRLPFRSGIECTRKLKEILPKVEILMFTACEDPIQIFESFRAGACGYLLKQTPPATLIRSLLEAAQGGGPMSSSVARRVVQSFKETRFIPPTDCEPLTERESEVVRWMSQGHSEKEIAAQLHISVNTIKTHRKRIYQKLEVHSRDSILRMKR